MINVYTTNARRRQIYVFAQRRGNACLALKRMECTLGTEGWISPTELRVPLLGYFKGAGTWVGCCVEGVADEAYFLLT